MAVVQILQNKSTGEIIFVPFAFNHGFGGGSVASGDLLRLSGTEFRSKGREIAESLIAEHDTRDFSVLSELYELMSRESRDQMLKDYWMVDLAIKIQKGCAKVSLGNQFTEVLLVP
jgi:hypothetical protein